MKEVSEVIYPALGANKNLVTDESKTVDSDDYVSGGASLSGTYTNGGTNAHQHTIGAGGDTTVWFDLKFPNTATGEPQISTPVVAPGDYLILGQVGVYVADSRLAPCEFQVRVTNGVDNSEWIPVTLALENEIEQIAVIVPITSTMNRAFRLQGRTVTNLATVSESATFYIEVSSALSAMTTDANNITSLLPSRIPSDDYTEYASGAGHFTWADQINDDPDPVDHLYSIAFTTPATMSGNEHIFGVGDGSAAQMLFLKSNYELQWCSGNSGVYLFSNGALSPSTSYSVVIFVDATNNTMTMWVKSGTASPTDITVLDSHDDVESGYLDTVHATDTGGYDGWVGDIGVSANFYATIYSTGTFAGTIDQGLRIYVGQRAQGA